MNCIQTFKIFEGEQRVYEHESSVLNCKMRFGFFHPGENRFSSKHVLIWLSGLTCTEQNFITKTGFQRKARELGMVVVAPDTSPRGENIPDDDAYDLGQGAGFYLNATNEPWNEHFKMESYIIDELIPLLSNIVDDTVTFSIAGHSMGGHGALNFYLKYPKLFTKCSAVAPITSPTQVPWGQKAFSHYLGDDINHWKQYDTVALIRSGMRFGTEVLVDQGDKDEFLERELKPELFKKACNDYEQPLNFRMHAGYDHSFFFISTVIGDHLEFHCS